MNYTKHKRIKKEITPNTHHHHSSSSKHALEMLASTIQFSHNTPHNRQRKHQKAPTPQPCEQHKDNNAPDTQQCTNTPHTRTHTTTGENTHAILYLSHPQTSDNQATMKCHHPHPNGMSTNTRYVSTRLKNKQQQHKQSLNHPTPNANLHGTIKTP